MHRLQSPAFIDPRWFQDVRYGIQEAQAVDGRSINLAGQVLRLADTEAFILLPGQQVFVTCLDRFYLITAEEQAEQLRQARERIEREKQERQEKSNRLRREAEAFNATLHVPVKWLSGIKDVLSGLSEKSDGTGTNAATVIHIWLQEDLHDGRLHRNQFDFLCTAASGSNGKQWSWQTEYWLEDGERNRYQAKVTCRTCLKIAERWKKVE